MNVAVKIVVGTLLFSILIVIGMIPLTTIHQGRVIDDDSIEYSAFNESVNTMVGNLEDATDPFIEDTESDAKTNIFQKTGSFIGGVVEIPSTIYKVMSSSFSLLAKELNIPKSVLTVVMIIMVIFLIIGARLLMKDLGVGI